MTTKHLVSSGLFALSLAMATAPVAYANESASTSAVSTSVPESATLGSSAEEKRYAARAAESPDARKFQGGDVIVISATTLAIVLLVILILVLI
jgi:hypothetical protein